MPNSLKITILKCLVWPVVMYGCEAWTLRREEEKKLEAAEMYLYRQLLRVTWKDKRTNESILEELSTERILLQEIKRRKLRYLGHANRNTRTDLMTSIHIPRQSRSRGKKEQR